MIRFNALRCSCVTLLTCSYRYSNLYAYPAMNERNNNLTKPSHIYVLIYTTMQITYNHFFKLFFRC